MDKLNQIREGTGALEIAACPCIGLYRLPPLLRAFQQSFPGVTVRVRHASHDGVHQAMRNNLVDAGLVPYPRHEPGLAAVPFENGRHTVPVAAIHRKRRKLPPALRHFLQFLQQPEPGEKV